MKILDGKKLNAQISEQLSSEITNFKSKGLDTPCLVIFQIGNNQASNIYISRKIKFAEKIGVKTEVIKLEDTISEADLLKKASEKNAEKGVTGIILQLPLPEHISPQNFFDILDANKDVDGLGSENLSKLIHNEKGVVPATARGVATLLEENNISVEGKNVVVVGRSVLVGKSTALNLINKNATVTICHSKTKELGEIIKKSDIIISATGQIDLIKDSYIKPEHIIVDIGINVVNEKIVGDVAKDLKNFPEFISPVPGGVGPMTVASLYMNLIDSYKKQNDI